MDEAQAIEQTARKLDPEAHLAHALAANDAGSVASSECSVRAGYIRPTGRGKSTALPTAERLDESQLPAGEQRRGLGRFVEHRQDRIGRIEQAGASRRVPSRVPTAMWTSWTRSSGAPPALRHDVDDARRRSDAAERQQPLSLELGVPPQLLARDVKQSAQIAIVRAQTQGGVHHSKIEVVMAGIDDHRRASDASRERFGIGGVHFDARDAAPQRARQAMGGRRRCDPR